MAPSFFDYVLWGGLALLGMYLVARLATAAFFNSKRQYDQQRMTNG
jgi:hypothetical protein